MTTASGARVDRLSSNGNENGGHSGPCFFQGKTSSIESNRGEGPGVKSLTVVSLEKTHVISRGTETCWLAQVKPDSTRDVVDNTGDGKRRTSCLSTLTGHRTTSFVNAGKKHRDGRELITSVCDHQLTARVAS